MNRVFIVLGETVNSTILTFDTGDVIVIDTSVTEEQGRAVYEEAQKYGRVAYLINTHEHGDHLAGNKFFSCPKISSAPARESIIRMPNVDPATVPTVTFDHKLTLHLGETVELTLMGGHCLGVCAIYLPERKLLFTGDNVFNGRMPYMGAADFPSWIKVLKELESWDVTHVVPGHGPVGGKEILKAQRAWLEQFVAEVHAWHKAGVTQEQMFEKLCQKHNPVERWYPMLKRAIELALLA